MVIFYSIICALTRVPEDSHGRHHGGGSREAFFTSSAVHFLGTRAAIRPTETSLQAASSFKLLFRNDHCELCRFSLRRVMSKYCPPLSATLQSTSYTQPWGRLGRRNGKAINSPAYKCGKKFLLYGSMPESNCFPLLVKFSFVGSLSGLLRT